MKNTIKLIGFDADDTLWVNEPFFREAEEEFCSMFKDIYDEQEVMDILFKTEIGNLTKYGYGSKAFMLSAMETSLKILGDKMNSFHVSKILEIGSGLLTKPRKLIDGVEECLNLLSAKYKLILLTKGDLLEQEQKLNLSGLKNFFHHTEILSEKNTDNYNILLSNLNICPEEFLMVGNSLKSDILPILELGCYGAHIPFYITWKHEEASIEDKISEKFISLEHISQLQDLLI